MATQNSNSTNATAGLSQNLSKMIAGGSLDYNSWRSLILDIETASPEDINTISLAYESFLSMFPLCHWHLEKYAYQKAKLCSSQEAINIYERGAEAAMFSVGFWVDYFTFAAACLGDPEDVRRLFGRAISFVGKDYFCHILWDKHMKYEFNKEGWSFLAQSYIQVLKSPTKKLHFYYDNFKQFVANLEEEMGYDKNNSIVEHVSVPCDAPDVSNDEISLIIKDMLDSSERSLKSKALDRYRSIGEKFYQEACKMDEKIKRFETKIQRRYFDVTPLDDEQLNNWHLYLDFIEKEDNLDWAMKLYERCLIPCANYPEFWMRYVEFLESKGGRELAMSALTRATHIFLKNVPEIHVFDARFKEHIGDANGARAALALSDTNTDSRFIENVAVQANLERRLGNSAVASATYEKALKMAKERQKLHLLPSLYSNFARLTFLMTGSAAAARDVLIEGVRQVPHCRFLLEELVKFAMTHEGASHVNIIDSVIADAISPGLDEYEVLNAKNRENISCLFLEFVDLCGSTRDIRKAWSRHIKLFPHWLRIKAPYKHSTSGNYLTGLARDKKGNYDPPVHSQPSRNPCVDRHDQLQGQEQVPEFPVNNGILTSEIAGKLSPQKDQSNDGKETEQVLSTKVVVSSNGDESRDKEPAYEFACESREDGPRPMVVSAELADQAKENALGVRDSDQDIPYQSRGDVPGAMDVSPELGTESKENALSPHVSAHDIVKSTETTEPVEAPQSRLMYVQPELDHEFKQQKHPVSLDNVSLKSQEKESQELIPMSCEEHETKRGALASSESTPQGNSNVNSNSFAGTKSTPSVDSPQVHSESERDGSVSRQHNTPTQIHMDPIEPSSTPKDSIEVDHSVPSPGRATSRFKEHVQDQEYKSEQSSYQDHHPANALNSKTVASQGNTQQNLAGQKRSQSELGAVQEGKATDQDERRSMTPSNNMSAGQPVSSQPVCYPQQNMNQIASLTSQYPWQAQQSLAMNQMLQYYHQQYQQYPCFQLQQQYMNQQPYQLQPEQHNQQLVHQQHYVQQQHHPLPTYQQQQQLASFQQSQQQWQQNHQQSQQMQGQESDLNFQQAQKQYHQSQDLAYQAHQLAYQQYASQEQQMLLQQYQQYSGYQHLQPQQQSREGSVNMQEHHPHQHPAQKQQDELLQQHHQQVHPKQNLTQNMSQMQQVSKNATPGYDGSAKSSESPHLRVQSPQDLE